MGEAKALESREIVYRAIEEIDDINNAGCDTFALEKDLVKQIEALELGDAKKIKKINKEIQKDIGKLKKKQEDEIRKNKDFCKEIIIKIDKYIKEQPAEYSAHLDYEKITVRINELLENNEDNAALELAISAKEKVKYYRFLGEHLDARLKNYAAELDAAHNLEIPVKNEAKELEDLQRETDPSVLKRELDEFAETIGKIRTAMQNKAYVEASCAKNILKKLDDCPDLEYLAGRATHAEELILGNDFNTSIELSRSIVNDIEFLLQQQEDARLVKLPFTHGIECELQVISANGKWVPGDKMKKVFREIFLNTMMQLQNVLAEDDVPYFIREKVGEVSIQKDGHGNDAVHVEYKLGEETKKWSVIGKDSHVSFQTNILEIQTPPCSRLKELEWWLATIFRISYTTVKKRKEGLVLIPTGMNPYEPFSRGVSFGDHHHLGIQDDEVRTGAYNMIRNFLPHIIALNVNSPFQHGQKPHVDRSQTNSLTLPHGTMSSRLALNNRQLHMVPALDIGDTDDDFMRKTKKDKKSKRMVDINPFSTWGTIEIRCIDSQLTLSNRLALAVLLQAMALKVRNMAEAGLQIPCVSEKSLKTNRENTIISGPLALLLTEQDMLGEDEPGPYHQVFTDEGRKAVLMYEACASMLHYLREELEELNILATKYLHPVLIQIFGSKEQRADFWLPLSPAQYQMLKYTEFEGDMKEFRKFLDEISQKCADSPNYNPIIELMGEPVVPDFLVEGPKEGDDC